jgi:hypothetical protein
VADPAASARVGPVEGGYADSWTRTLDACNPCHPYFFAATNRRRLLAAAAKQDKAEVRLPLVNTQVRRVWRIAWLVRQGMVRVDRGLTRVLGGGMLV